MSDGPLLDAVSSLDPAREPVALDSEAMLARITEQASGATGDGADVARLVPRRASRPARRLALGAAALTAAAVGVVVVQQVSGPEAYATWTATPAAVQPGTNAEACPPFVPGPDMTTEIAVAPVLAEQRGAYTFVVLAGDGAFAECLVSTATAEPFVVSQGTLPPAGAALDPGAAPVLVVDPGSTWGAEGGEGVVTTVVGVAMDDVTSVVVTTADGTSAEATVENGWWAVWFPGEVEIGDDVVVTTSDGEESALSFAGLLAEWLGAGDG